MMQNPYEPTLNLAEFSSKTSANRIGFVQRGLCWLLIFTGIVLIVYSLVFVAGNGLAWLNGNRPVGVQSLMLFVVISFGAIPATVGFALQHYARRYLRWRTKNPS